MKMNGTAEAAEAVRGYLSWARRCEIDIATAAMVIATALPHLDVPEPTPARRDGEYWTNREEDAYQRGLFIGHSRGAKQATEHAEKLYAGQREAWEKQLIQGDTVELNASEPTDYEVWRDALQLSCTTIGGGPDWSTRVLLENAEWFHGRLKAGPPGPPVPDCPHCGADLSMDHDEGCPNGEDEEDCPNCGTDDDEHEEGCPREGQID